MQINMARVRQCLKDFDFTRLFVEELGWDRYSTVLDVTVDGRRYALAPVAQKRGMVAYVMAPPADNRIPDYPTRRKIDHQVTKSAREHLIVYTDPARTIQVWQWVKREPGKPTACREHTFHRDQPGDALIQKLQAVAFSLEEEAGLTLVDVTGRVRAGFDIEKVTKRFYDLFKTEHAAFLKFLKGIPDGDMQRWYVSVMLNRLMFIYFIQKKGFLDDDPNYLGDRLAASKARGKDRFYRDFLCPLFFEGFAKKEQERSAAVNALLGKVPFLNGGLFLKHQIEEQHGRAIAIADAAFECLFGFFDRYHWHLDERPLRQDNEINPDVLGYIFEKYINQKQMGAYYTKEDITGYISRNTVIPFLFDAARPKCRIAFEGGQSIWRLLAADPDRYIHPAVRIGVIDEQGQVIPESALPEFVRKGMNDPKARMFNRDYNLGRAVVAGPDGANLALPTETWREYVERRKRCLDLRARLARGEVRNINDLITLNLDVEQFAQDVIENSEGPELLRAFWHAILQVTVLDPTCGSGAFLFAALNILESLYEACLDRMEVFLDELDRSGQKHRPEKFADFRKVRDRVAKHPNRKYFVFKSIVINNLYGVDIMDEAVEICKLRLFLKLVAQIERPDQIEPLPDIDFNIRAGNTLVGYASLDQFRKTAMRKLDGEAVVKAVEAKAQNVDRLFGLFRQQQTELGGTVTGADKQALRDRIGELENELNRYLASDYAIERSKKTTYPAWLASHKPFHWFVEFYGMMKLGGFDVVIGNPPYVEYRKVRGDYSIEPCHYATESAENLYAFCIERSADLLGKNGRFGMIVPSSVVGLDETLCVRTFLMARFPALYVSTYSIRPSKLFDGVDQRLCILLGDGRGHGRPDVLSTRYLHWCSEERVALFSNLRYAASQVHPRLKRIAQTGCPEALSILTKLEQRSAKDIGDRYSPDDNGFPAHYHRSPRYWIRAMDFEQYFKSATRSRSIHHFRDLTFTDKAEGKAVCAIVNSGMFFFWFMTVCNGRNLTNLDVSAFPVGSFDDRTRKQLVEVFDRLMKDYRKNSFVRKRSDCEYQEFQPSCSKLILDEIDQILAKHYGLTDAELDFIVNYVVKYRLGADTQDADE